MSYLPINRYWGDECNYETDEPVDALQNLLSKVEERKRKRELLNICKERDTNVEADNERKQELVTDRPGTKNRKLQFRVKKDESILNENIAKFTTDVNNRAVDNANNYFTILENLQFKKSQKIKRVLPSWLSNPSIVSVDLKNLDVSVNDIPELDASLVAKLKKNRITHFFPVQTQLIPWILRFHTKCRRFWPRDVCVSAPTGSGKTLAFVLPIVQLLKNRVVRSVRAVVVLPTKDLAIQVYKVFKKYCVDTDIKIVHLGNGTLEKEGNKIVVEDEVLGYRSLVDIIVTTPGRLVEHIKYTRGISFSNLRFLVIDEADHVMDSVQNDWLKHLLTRIPPFGVNSEVPYLTLNNIVERPPRTQKLLFSATLSQDPEKLKQLNLFQPCLFTSVVKAKNNGKEESENIRTIKQDSTEFIGKYATPAELEEWYTICPLPVKPLMLYHIIKTNNWKRILCFADSVSNVHKLTTLLKELSSLDEGSKELNILEISSKLHTDTHREILEKFSKNKIDILVTTDALARGIDLQNVEYVVLYDAPKFMKNYIHRVGRTGRAGKRGTSLVLVTPDQKEHFDEIFTIIGKNDVKELRIELSDLKELENVYKDALKALRTDVEMEKVKKKNIQILDKRKRKRN